MFSDRKTVMECLHLVLMIFDEICEEVSVKFQNLISFPFLSAIFSLKNPEETKKNEE